MITLMLAACILAGSLFVGFKLDQMAKAFERYGDRQFGVEEALREHTRALNRSRPETKRKK